MCANYTRILGEETGLRRFVAIMLGWFLTMVLAALVDRSSGKGQAVKNS